MLSKNLIAASGNSGGESYWYNLFNFSGQTHADADRVLVNSEGDYIVQCGGSLEALIKTNSDGEVIWSKGLYATSISNMALDSQDNIIIVSYQGEFALVSKISTTGAVVFSKGVRVSSSSVWFHSAYQVVVDSQDNIIFNGSVNYDFGGVYESRMYVAKMDSNGNIIWWKGQFELDTLGGLAVDSQDNIIAVFVDYNYSDTIINKLSSTGNIIFSSHYNNFSSSQNVRPVDVVVDSNDDIIVLSNYYRSGASKLEIIKVLANGNYSWSKRIEDTRTHRVKDINIDSDDNIILVNEYKGIYKLNSSGVMQFCLDFTFSTIMSIFSTSVDEDDNLIIAGNLKDLQNNRQGLVIKIPSDTSSVGTHGGLTVTSRSASTVDDSFYKENGPSVSTDYVSTINFSISTSNATVSMQNISIEV